ALVGAGQRPAALLVGIGYDVDARLDTEARAWDYTPRLPGADVQGTPDPRQAARRNGGADDWLDLIEHRVKPLVRQAAPVDTARQTLYGHSYGGLFVLHALAARPLAFQRYVAASPSLWWHAPYMADRLRGLDTAGCCASSPRRLYLWVGESEQSRGHRRAQQADPGRISANVQNLSAELAGKPGLDVRYRGFPGLGHGPMLPASAREALGVATLP
ncbi:alpha/beta hydrolase, partial [Bordetella petrii]|uniref:alpha/beta hydrolase n=1 Tax=Bordetella petrii TaxID=94624 RepID=UPI001E5639F0